MQETDSMKYRIGNPRNVSKGTRVMAYGDQEWFEGDDFVRPDGFLPEVVQICVVQGFIVEVDEAAEAAAAKAAVEEAESIVEVEA